VLSSDPPVTLSEMRPVVQTNLSTVLIGEAPISEDLASELLPEFTSSGRSNVAMLTKLEADAIAERLGMRLPTESEWEAICRAGTDTLFAWGNDILNDIELDFWLDWSVSPRGRGRNGWGFYGLFFGEWCGDEFKISHDVDAPALEGEYVIKGGGAQFWPWQEEEWVGCLSAMRMPSSALFDDGKCAARLVYDPRL